MLVGATGRSPKGGKTVEVRREKKCGETGDVRRETVEETLARYVITPCLRNQKRPHRAGNLSPLPSPLSPLLWGRGEVPWSDQ